MRTVADMVVLCCECFRWLFQPERAERPKVWGHIRLFSQMGISQVGMRSALRVPNTNPTQDSLASVPGNDFICLGKRGPSRFISLA